MKLHQSMSCYRFINDPFFVFPYVATLSAEHTHARTRKNNRKKHVSAFSSFFCVCRLTCEKKCFQRPKCNPFSGHYVIKLLKKSDNNSKYSTKLENKTATYCIRLNIFSTIQHFVFRFFYFCLKMFGAVYGRTISNVIIHVKNSIFISFLTNYCFGAIKSYWSIENAVV